MFDGAFETSDVLWWGSVVVGVYAVEAMNVRLQKYFSATSASTAQDRGLEENEEEENEVFSECEDVEECNLFEDCLEGFEQNDSVNGDDRILVIQAELLSMAEERDMLRKKLDAIKMKIEMLENHEEKVHTNGVTVSSVGSGSSAGKENESEKAERQPEETGANGYCCEKVETPPCSHPTRNPFTSTENNVQAFSSIVFGEEQDRACQVANLQWLDLGEDGSCQTAKSEQGEGQQNQKPEDVEKESTTGGGANDNRSFGARAAHPTRRVLHARRKNNRN